MKFRIGIIGILAIFNLILLGVVILYVKEPKIKKNPPKVIIHETIEQTASMEHPDFVKEEYVLVLPEGENIALGKKVKASGFHDVYTPRKVVDGIAVGTSYWEGKADEYPNILTIDLGESYAIHAIRVCLSPMAIWGKRTQTFSVHISEDGENFTELYAEKEYVFDPDSGNEVQLLFDSIKAQFVRLEITSNTGASGGQIAEFEIYSK